MKKIKKLLNQIEKRRLYPDLRIIESPPTPTVEINGREILMFSSNNYLSLATHPKVMQAGLEAVKKYGTGSCGSRLLSGNLDLHKRLEKKLVQFKGGEEAIVWPSGYAANVGIISAVMNIMKVPGISLFRKKGVILSDELNHASIIDGCTLSKQEVKVYQHLDMKDLERKLKKHRRRRKMIVTDGVFSMDGDIAPLDKISRLAEEYKAITMVDEAHATGVLGESGKGTLEHFGLEPIKDIDIVMGTLSKAVASTGGYVVGTEELVRYLRVTSRSYMFSTAMTPAASASAIAAFEVIEEEPVWKKRMWRNSRYLKKRLQEVGYDTLGSETQIIPALIGSDEKAIKFSRRLFEKGVFGPSVRWPAVEKGKARVRFTVMAKHTKDQIDFLVDACQKIGERLNII